MATAKRSPSSGSRTNARTTRMPVICSRSTWLTRSMRSCMNSNVGMSRITTMPMLPTSTGIATTRISESGPSSRTAMNRPPTIMIGALTNSVQSMTTSICICCTSLVMRVISDAAPKLLTSAVANDVTRRKSAPRTSRPNAIAAFAPK